MNWSELWENIVEHSSTFVSKLIMIALTLLIAHLINVAISNVFSRVSKRANQLSDRDRAKQINTTMTIFTSVVRFSLFILSCIFILDQLGYGSFVNKIFVTAGLGTLVLTWGAQDIIDDLLSGVFLLFEKQFTVGDYVAIGNYTGTVTELSLRVTRLRTYQGQIVVIPNGKIESVLNYGNNSYSLANIVVPTPYNMNTEHIIEILQEEMDKHYEANKPIYVSSPTILGINTFNTSSVDIGIVAQTIPMKQWEVERGWRMAIKKRFDEEGISIPYQTVTISNLNQETEKPED